MLLYVIESLYITQNSQEAHREMR